MEKIKMELANCYGIQKMNHFIDYSNNNVAIIYAPNGTMKSSLAKTFKDLREGEEPRELVFGRICNYSITDEAGLPINPNDIMVINPFDEEDFSEQGLLMANPKLRKKYISIHKGIDEKKEKLYEKIKEELGFGKRSVFNPQSTMLGDWGYDISKEKEC